MLQEELPPPNGKGYWSATTLCTRFEISKRTLLRWMEREDNPFPQPQLDFGNYSLKRWLIDDVEAWEEAVSASTQ